MIEKNKETRDLLLHIVLMIFLSLVLLLVSFSFSSSTLEIDMFKSQVGSPSLVILNLIPILVLFALLWALTNRFFIAYLITSLLIFAGGMANRSKLTYRDDPVAALDLTLIKEGMLMAKEYELPITMRIVLTFLGLSLMGFLIYRFSKIRLSPKKRVFMGLGLLGLVFLGGSFYFDEKLYESQGDYSLINPWIESERFQTKGFVYPFIYSSKDLVTIKPPNYSEARAREILSQYEYEDIKGTKVNIIAIMLEAYNDFSKFDGVEIDPSVYENYRKIKEESISGDIVTNVFAGGTIDTERAFLTSYKNHPKYFKRTNSHVWYLKDQGYRTEASHPITGSFYNRRNINEYLGFDKFYHQDNYFKDYTEYYLRDKEFFPHIIEAYEEARDDKVPYFHFSVTYQNHGPYDEDNYYKEDYLLSDHGLSQAEYGIINNYLGGIKETDKAIKDLVDYFSREDEPVVLVFFGDHNPWLGKENSIYKALGIDLGLGEPEGFLNYYKTPYLIWANERAKEEVGNDFKEDQGDIGPNNLMIRVYDALGYKGDEYSQYVRNFSKDLPVIHKDFFLTKDGYKKNLDQEDYENYLDYRSVEYYQSNRKKPLD